MAENYLPQTHQYYTQVQYWTMGVISALLLFLSVLLHELGHSFVALRYGVRVTSVRLLIFGGLAEIDSEPQSGRHEFLIALAGPAVSIVLVMFFFAIYFYLAITGSTSPIAVVAGVLASGNLVLVLFNLIPGFPLDGGRILRAILWDQWNDMARATKVVSQIGNAFALFLIVFGILQFFVTRQLIAGLWFIFIGLFMKQAASGSYQAMLLRRALAGVPVRQIMTEEVVSVDWLTSVDELVRDYIYKHHFTSYPVFNRDEFVGMVSLDAIKPVPKELWGFKQVRDVMTPIEQVPCLRPDDDATEALYKMVSGDIGSMPVVDNGRLIGIVSRRDILNLFKIRSDLGLS